LITPAIELLTVSCPSAKRKPGAALRSTATTEMWTQCLHELGSFCLDTPRITSKQIPPNRPRRKVMPMGVKASRASSMKRNDDPHTTPRARKPGSHDGGFFTGLPVLFSPNGEVEDL
jgi:hypothetical protein